MILKRKKIEGTVVTKTIGDINDPKKKFFEVQFNNLNPLEYFYMEKYIERYFYYDNEIVKLTLCWDEVI